MNPKQVLSLPRIETVKAAVKAVLETKVPTPYVTKRVACPGIMTPVQFPRAVGDKVNWKWMVILARGI